MRHQEPRHRARDTGQRSRPALRSLFVSAQSESEQRLGRRMPEVRWERHASRQGEKRSYGKGTHVLRVLPLHEQMVERLLDVRAHERPRIRGGCCGGRIGSSARGRVRPAPAERPRPPVGGRGVIGPHGAGRQRLLSDAKAVLARRREAVPLAHGRRDGRPEHSLARSWAGGASAGSRRVRLGVRRALLDRGGGRPGEGNFILQWCLLPEFRIAGSIGVWVVGAHLREGVSALASSSVARAPCSG